MSILPGGRTKPARHIVTTRTSIKSCHSFGAWMNNAFLLLQLAFLAYQHYHAESKALVARTSKELLTRKSSTQRPSGLKQRVGESDNRRCRSRQLRSGMPSISLPLRSVRTYTRLAATDGRRQGQEKMTSRLLICCSLPESQNRLTVLQEPRTHTCNLQRNTLHAQCDFLRFAVDTLSPLTTPCRFWQSADEKHAASTSQRPKDGCLDQALNQRQGF